MCGDIFGVAWVIVKHGEAEVLTITHFDALSCHNIDWIEFTHTALYLYMLKKYHGRSKEFSDSTAHDWLPICKIVIEAAEQRPRITGQINQRLSKALVIFTECRELVAKYCLCGCNSNRLRRLTSR